MDNLTQPDLPLALAPQPRQPRFRLDRRYFLVLLVPVFLFMGAVLGMYFQPPGLQKFYALTGLEPGAGSANPIALSPEIVLPDTLAATLLPSDVVGLARLMPRADVSIVAAPYGAGDARLAEILVSVGDVVAKGAPLARLDNQSALASAVLSAQAALAIKEAALMQTRAQITASRDEAQAALEQAIAAQTEALAEQARSETLFARKVLSSTARDQARAAAQTAVLAVARARASVTRYGAELAVQPDVMVAQRSFEAAQADLARAQMDQSRALVVAPIAGTILDIHAQAGERPPAEGIMEMGDIGQMMAEVEIWQDRIARVAVGQPVELIAEALGQSLHGTVARIGLTVGRQGLISDDAAENKDARVIRVLVGLDPRSSQIAQHFTNLEVIARVATSTQARP